ncbi:hypothetical protein KOR42_35960 [Thalassoglobus neptunius]|uniref:Uncharacterized protein n=1 Tax=Thalassoglobus neptunius TaxID=1938619 RepID=A0A5C5WLJ9_9PLAN|nr:DUF6263 family protein [Thalassoglobus neptunius]TWT51548.1 hypothetical protein KOR42_35960 [Thalassoglobus neptunius]
MILRILSLTAVLITSPLTVFAQTDLSYAPTFEQGEVTKSEVEMDIDQTLNIAGMDIVTAVDNYIVIKQTVESATSGQVKMLGNLELMQMNMELPGGVSLNFDTGNPNNAVPDGPLADIAKYIAVAAESTWEITYGDNHEVKSAKYTNDSNQDLPEAFSEEMSDDRLKKETETAINRLPKEPVAVGDTWERNEEAYLGSGQVFYLVREYTYVGPEQHNGKSMDKIDVKTKSLTFEISGGKLPLELKDSELEVESSGGTLWYDPAIKDVVESSSDMHIVGDLTFIANGQELPSSLDLVMKVGTKQNRQ